MGRKKKVKRAVLGVCSLCGKYKKLRIMGLYRSKKKCFPCYREWEQLRQLERNKQVPAPRGKEIWDSINMVDLRVQTGDKLKRTLDRIIAGEIQLLTFNSFREGV